MNTIKGELSFVLNGVNYGVAYKGIPLDKPLVPCIILHHKDDSVELDTFEVKENEDNTIPILSNIVANSEIAWDSITLTWDVVEGASLYQIEVDGINLCDIIKTNTFTKRGFLPCTEHSFRVRTVRGNTASEWSDVVKGRTLMKSFESSGWEECPDDIDKKRKYSVNKNNPRIVTKAGDDYPTCTIIGNTHILFNKITSWSIKILESKYNDGNGIFIGIAPFDISQNEEYNYNKCGWYFYCYSSSLWSGPPHNYQKKEYGPRKGDGKYIHRGDTVGVVMDTTKCELSFVFDGMNYGVAYEGIPLDKPLVPCVLLYDVKVILLNSNFLK